MAASSRDRLASESTAATTSSVGSSTGSLRWLSVLTLGLLLVQILLGMFVNLFVKIPDSHPGTEGNLFRGALAGLGWAIGTAGGSLTLHVLLGLLLGLSTIVVLVLAIAQRRLNWTILAVLGFLATLYAGLNGIAFMDRGQRDENSFEMTVGFAIATAAYVIALILPERPTAS